MTKVVITMPAYHAADTLERTVADIPVGIADELILVDDASGDETVAVARKLNITVYVHDENRGYGGNQKTCYRRALEHGADIVVMLHPDYQYDPTAVPLLIAPLLAGRADMTFGSRFAGLSDPRGGGMPLYRYLGNRTATTLENLMLGSRFTELHSGLRAYTRRCLLELPILRYSDDFVFDSQLIVDAVTTGQRVVEVPIETRYTKESSSISVGQIAALRRTQPDLLREAHGDARTPWPPLGRHLLRRAAAAPLAPRPCRAHVRALRLRRRCAAVSSQRHRRDFGQRVLVHQRRPRPPR